MTKNEKISAALKGKKNALKQAEDRRNKMVGVMLTPSEFGEVKSAAQSTPASMFCRIAILEFLVKLKTVKRG